MKSIRAHLELVSESTVSNIIKKDAADISSNPDKFVKDNLLGYYVLINTWLMMIKQWSEYAWVYVLAKIQKDGIFNTINYFSEASAKEIRGEQLEGVAYQLKRDIFLNPVIRGCPFTDDYTFLNNPRSAFLLLCRYPKRFTPVGADLLAERSLNRFVEKQRELKVWQRTGIPRWLSKAVRKKIEAMFDWDRLIEALDGVDITDIVFTPGVSFDTGSSLVSKLRSVAKEAAEYFPSPFGCTFVAHKGVNPELWGCCKDEVHAIRLVTVPKNYKTNRVIAPENVVRQAFARRYFIIWDSFLPAFINLHDQGQNQRLALQGSLDGSISTLDLKDASDSITATHIRELFPARMVRILTKVLPTHYTRAKASELKSAKYFLLQSAATMGNSVTFILESVLFLAIILVAMDYYRIFSNLSDEEFYHLLEKLSVYGDDLAVPTCVAQTVIEFLEMMGFTVNSDKSFTSETLLYRESCGVEYDEGVNLSSLYFPRFPIEGTFDGFSSHWFRDGFTGEIVTTSTSLVALQRKMFATCQPASLLLTEVLNEGFKGRLTYSDPADDVIFDGLSYDRSIKPTFTRLAEIEHLFHPKWKGLRLGSKLNNVKLQLDDPRYEFSKRESHLCPVTKYDSSKATEEDRMLVHLYEYQRFLREGPRYANELDRLLGVTMKPNYDSYLDKGEIAWVFRA